MALPFIILNKPPKKLSKLIVFIMNILEKFQEISTFIFDVDGVLTDNRLVVFENGQLVRTMNARDGYAMKLAVEAGYRICIITGGKSEGVILRLKGLGIEDIYSGIRNKLEVYEEYCYAHELDQEQILYMGDDVPDYWTMRHVGLPTCPQDACGEILSVAQYVSPFKGGDGCVRDVIEKVMKLQGKWSV
jgi:3-deoxy-D-manno-octulosonate 8-phosphate phosphatase (KDO 8-P phosphatase)